MQDMQAALAVRPGRAFHFDGDALTFTASEDETPDGTVLVVNVDGRMNTEDLRNGFAEKHASPHVDATLPCLLDLRDHDFTGYNGADFRRMAVVLGALSEKCGEKTGIVVSDTLGYGMMRMFQGMAENTRNSDGTAYCVSYDPRAIVAWLQNDRPCA